MTTNGQICKMSYTAYCNMYCNMGQVYCSILRYAFCRIVSPLIIKVKYGSLLLYICRLAMSVKRPQFYFKGLEKPFGKP